MHFYRSLKVACPWVLPGMNKGAFRLQSSLYSEPLALQTARAIQVTLFSAGFFLMAFDGRSLSVSSACP